MEGNGRGTARGERTWNPATCWHSITLRKGWHGTLDLQKIRLPKSLEPHCWTEPRAHDLRCCPREPSHSVSTFRIVTGKPSYTKSAFKLMVSGLPLKSQPALSFKRLQTAALFWVIMGEGWVKREGRGEERIAKGVQWLRTDLTAPPPSPHTWARSREHAHTFTETRPCSQLLSL